MRVCPSCNTRFVGGETFCPNDGTKLVQARDGATGTLTGATLDDVVRLDRLAYADDFAERYSGRLLQSRRAVYVTVFNQKFAVDRGATGRVESWRASVGSPLPEQVNTLLQTHFDADTPFLVESQPRGPSIRKLLDENGFLAWDDAVRIIANVARVMHWLHEHGVPHSSFHPSSVFVTRLQAGHVVVGDWAVEAIFPAGSAEISVRDDPAAFAGYVDYMSPEIARDKTKADIRSAVYGLGCLLYEMVLGTVPLPAGSPSDVLKRHQAEKPVRLSIAAGNRELHERLDDVMEMMLAKDPGNRFQSPAAAIGALASLLGEAPDAVAPKLQRATQDDEDDLYRTIDLESIDRTAIDPPPALAPKEGRGGTGQFGKPAAAAESDDTQEVMSMADADAKTKPTSALPSDAAKKTLVLGSQGAVTVPPPNQPGPDTEEPRKTMLNFGVRPKSGPMKKPGHLKSPVKNKKGGPSTAPPGEPPPRVRQASGASAAVPRGATAADQPTNGAQPSNSVQVDPALAAPAELDDARKETLKFDFASPDATTPLTGVEPDQATTPSVDTPAARAVTAALPPVSAAAPPAEQAAPVPADTTAPMSAEAQAPKRTRRPTTEFDRGWFASGNADDVWESSLAREHAESSERRNRTTVVVIVLALLAGAAALVAWVEFFGDSDATDAAVVQPENQDAGATEPTAQDLAELQKAFDDAVNDGRIIEPTGNCALTHLQTLQRRAPESEEYVALRTKFVESAQTAAAQAEHAGDLRNAHALTSKAAEFAPDNAELNALAAALRSRISGEPTTDAGTTDAATDSGSSDAGADADAEIPEVAVAEVEPDKQEKPEPKSKRNRKKSRKKTEKPKKWNTGSTATATKAPAGGGDADALARQGQAAHRKGDVAAARRLFKQALDKDPRSTMALAGLGQIHFEKADYRSAVKYQTKAVRFAPTRNDYRINLGQSYYRLGKYESAISVWEKVLARDPNNTRARQYVELAKRKLKN